MITLYILLPASTSNEERRYAITLFESQFKRQIASRVKDAPGLSWTIEMQLPDLVPFTEEQVRYLKDKQFRLESTPDVPCKVCHEPMTDKVAAMRVEQP